MTQFDASLDLHFNSYGSGKPVIVLHGLFGSQVNWRTFGKQLGESCRVFTLDLRNHGDSPHSDEFNYDLMAADVARFMEKEKLDDAILLGHSLGGKVAMRFATAYPDKIQKLIVVDIALKEYPAVHKRLFEAVNNLDLARFSRLQQVVDALASDIPPLDIRWFLVKNLARGDNQKFRWKINMAAIANSYEEIFKTPSINQLLDKPTLFIKGENSEYLATADLESARRTFPQAKMLTIKGAGHWVHIDAPEVFAEVVRVFSLE